MGFNKSITQGVHNLTTDDRTEIFYSSAHTGVIYNYETKKQKLLQGHCNRITSTACSADKNLIVTADSGQDSMLVIWDSIWGTPKRTYFTPHENGVIYLDISPDSNYVVTLSNCIPQTISIWEINNEERIEPLVTTTFTSNKAKMQHDVRFNTHQIQDIVTTGKSNVVFFNWLVKDSDFVYYEPNITKNAF